MKSILMCVCLCVCIRADINECEVGDVSCAVNGKCVDTDGSYTCVCLSGFSGDGFNNCSG